MRVVGIDPGLRITGYGVLEGSGSKFKLIEAGCITSPEKDPMPRRLHELYTGVMELLKEVKPDSVAIEQLYSHYAHPRTAILMGHARGAIMLAAAMNDIPVESYSATMIKKSLTGNGHAQKAQVQRMVEVMLGLSKTPEPADVADAIAVAACHLNAASKTGQFTGRKK